MIQSSGLDFLCEAHSGLSARIVEEAGFQGIWASGLAISASLGVRDSNEASWTQVLDVLEFMCDAADIPILLDGDTGYGNFNNVRRLVRKLEQRGVAGVCMEDKLFPKTNSFLSAERQDLADMEEFAGKIRAAKDAQTDQDFVVVARTEAFIAGWGLEEALKRAHAYREAGADAVLVHSKKGTAEDVLAFMEAWENAGPVVIVPTTYSSTPTEVFEKVGVRMIIWANHILRASIRAMQEVAAKLHRERCLMGVEDDVAELTEVFRLQGAEELKEAERIYLPQTGAGSTAVVLAASRGSALGELTDERPKTMLPIQGEPLLARLVQHLHSTGIGRIRVVVGYHPEAVDVSGIEKVLNPEFHATKELGSLARGLKDVEGALVVSFGDILFKRYILRRLLDEPGDVVLAVDRTWREGPGNHGYRDLVRCSHAFTGEYFEAPLTLEELGPEVPEGEIHGEWIGLMRCTPAGTQQLQKAMDSLQKCEDFTHMRFRHLFQELRSMGVTVSVVYVSGHWLDVDDLGSFTASTEF
jgi:phosphoenolpyruvate phosphomutase